jgi:hypothetical protein
VHETRTPDFVSLLLDWEHRVSGKFLRANFVLRVLGTKFFAERPALKVLSDARKATTYPENGATLSPSAADRLRSALGSLYWLFGAEVTFTVSITIFQS